MPTPIVNRRLPSNATTDTEMTKRVSLKKSCILSDKSLQIANIYSRHNDEMAPTSLPVEPNIV
jgi:hypothetical protein